MSFSEEKRNQIKSYLLEKLADDDKQAVQKVAENFEITKTSVRRYIDAMIIEEQIVADETCMCGFRLRNNQVEYQYENAELEESTVFFHDIQKEIPECSEEAKAIWSYVFMEIFNNAIEHSKGDCIQVTVNKNALYTDIVIEDNGIGIFTNIMEHSKDVMGKNLDLEGALLELYKGKFTTAKECHSGEGIFFSSKLLDCLIIESEGHAWRQTPVEKEFISSHLLAYYHKYYQVGTRVIMRLNNFTKRSTKEVFEQYCDEDMNFYKTIIPMREVNVMAYPVARSEARRVMNRAEEFREVVLDFEGVSEIGQGFAHEIFVVYHAAHPEVTVTIENACPWVQKMIQHVEHGRR